MTQYIAFSGGKDSTAMALRMAELGEDFELLFTPTGNELPELYAHIDFVAKMTGRKFQMVSSHDLGTWINKMRMLPSTRARWCTRVLKIEPCAAFLSRQADPVLCVGLRADEEEREGGVYGAIARSRFPLREWGWGICEVQGYLARLGITVPRRTDCAVCPYQRLGEWYRLWRDRPDFWLQGEAWEAQIGYTFRSPSRDTWPAAMAGLRERFERGMIPKGGDDDCDGPAACRVCRF